MDSIRIPKVEQVAYTKSGRSSIGTLHLTAHHLIFHYNEEDEDKELWVPYPLISLSPLSFHTRTFESFSFTFDKDSNSLDVFESVKELTVATSVTQLYAFFYTPNPSFPTNNGWSIYSPREEFGRMGVGTRTKAWRFTDINKDYSFCSTYPSRLVVPTRISDTTLQYASKYRSKCRIPTLTYLHWANYGTLTRSSQPMVGITQNRSVQDEKLIEAVFQSHWNPDTRAVNREVYGATTTNLIIDARPTVNAVANSAKGAGTENMDHYKDSKKVYLGIDHIHTMRESLKQVVEALRESETLSDSGADPTAQISLLDRPALRRSGWLRHISAILEGTVIIVKNVHINSSHVLIHCSDGWDRTAQLSAMSQICLDPYYRTIKGLEILIEKDWLSYGHKFLDRCGHLSSEKFFLSPTTTAEPGSGAEAAQAFFTSVSNRFQSQSHVKETSPIFHQFLEAIRQLQRQFPERFEYNERFLRQLYYHLYACQYGTFLFNCERERRVGDGGPPPSEQTISVWDLFNTPQETALNTNPAYDPSLDDPKGRDMGVLIPNSKNVRFWNELYGRTDEEMSGRLRPPRGPEVVGPVEGAEDDPVTDRSPTPSGATATSPSTSNTTLAGSQTLSLPTSPPSRSTSPSLDRGLNNLSLSAPSLSAPSTGTTTGHVGRAGNSGAGTRSTPARSYSTSASNSGASTPLWSRSPDILSGVSGGGVRSLWGKLSSNASTALSAAQNAYVGIAKDLMNTNGGDEGSTQKTSELRSRDSLRAWGEEGSSPSSWSAGTPSIQPAPTLNLTNPWATNSTSRTPAKPSLLDDNPWVAPSPLDRPRVETAPSAPIAEPLSSLPPDPTIPSTLRQSSRSTGQTPSRVKTPPGDGKSGASSDPLGVGLW
ncbi:phosphatases II [Coprinellus micaceus]|uniref:Phosphatases II n=1 Tax=Coprinellus micaceus TaxID=71717 RepID=A0A4Y7SXK6_COPMI|nr:phosphatases II [Coprinellus micaceus]